MAEDKNNEEEKFDFTPEGEGYISLSEARVLAMQTASSLPGDYGRQYRGVAMVFAVAESSEDEDFYTVVLSVRPQRNFEGTPGQSNSPSPVPSVPHLLTNTPSDVNIWMWALLMSET